MKQLIQLQKIIVLINHEKEIDKCQSLCSHLTTKIHVRQVILSIEY